MVWEEWESAMAGCGLRTRAVRASIAEAGEQLRALLPFGKAALITDAGTDEQLTERVRASLRAYRPQCIFAEGEDASMPLFSLPDDVRAVVAVGPRSALAARFFCTLRGGFSLLIPLRPSAEELFAPAAPPPWAGYPLAAPDLILVDGEILQNAEEARAEAALAEDFYESGQVSKTPQELGFDSYSDMASALVLGEYMHDALNYEKQDSYQTANITVAVLSGDIHQLAIHYGMAKGIFADYGISITLSNQSAGPAAFTAMANGAAQFAFLGAPPMTTNTINGGYISP